MNKFDLYCQTQEHVKPISHEDNMRLALDAAVRAKSKGDIPVGAALVWPSRHFVEHNTVSSEYNPLNTAEINVIRKGAEMMPHKLRDGVLYTTVEPDVLSILTAHKAGVHEVIFGAYDLKHGFVSSKRRDLNLEVYEIAYKGGILAEECFDILPSDMQEYTSASESK